MDAVRAGRMARTLRGTAIGGWIIGDLLGNGASGLVFSADKGGQRGALKVIDPEMIERHGAEQQLVRVNRECELIEHLHPNLVKIFDGGRCLDSGHLFLVMELLDGEEHLTLTNAVADLPRNCIRPLIGQIASAANFLLEERGVAHRDIKPDNIMVTRDFSRAILLDLGVARPLISGADAGTGDAFVGTTRYSPPEYVFRQEEDTPDSWRSVTFYQLGAVLHDMIMRRPIFRDVQAPAAQIIDAVRSRTPEIEALDVEEHLVRLARRCLEKDWRLRLRLVKWEEFQAPPPTEAASAAKERIRLRMEMVGRTSGPATGERSTPRRKVLEQIGASLAATARGACRQSGLFPPVEVRHESHGDACYVFVKAGPSQSPSLNAALEVCLAGEPLNVAGTLLHVRGTATFGALPGGLPDVEWAEIYRGEQGSAELRDQLDAYIHGALDMAMEIGAAPSGGVRLRVRLTE